MKTNCARPLLPPRLLTVVATALALFSIAAQTSAIEQGRAALGLDPSMKRATEALTRLPSTGP